MTEQQAGMHPGNGEDQIHGHGLRERILSQATRLFLTNGYHGLAMRQIAEDVGVSKSALYYHFSDKEDLFLAIVESALDIYGRLITEARQVAPTCAGRLQWIIRRILEQPADMRAVIRMATQESAHLSEEAQDYLSNQYREEFLDPLTRILAEGVAAGELRPADPLFLTRSLLGLLYPYLEPVPGNLNLAEDLTPLLFDFFWNGARG